MQDKCFACDKKLKVPYLVQTEDGQKVFVGPECFKRVAVAGKRGYQPPLGGPKLILL